MKHSMVAILILALAPVVSAAREAEENPAVTVVKELVESMGGEAALGKIQGMRINYKGTYMGGGMESPYTSENTYILPDRLVWKLDAGGFRASMGVDGETSWTQFQCPPARCRGHQDEMIREWLMHYQITLAYPLLSRDDVELILVKTEERESLEHHHIKAVFGGQHEFTLVIGPSGSGKTTLLSFSGKVTQDNGEPGTFITKLSEPKAFGGIVMPSKYHARFFTGGEVSAEMSEEIVSIEWNPEVEEGTFAVPDRGEFGKPFVNEIKAHTGLVLVHRGTYDKMGETIEKAVGICNDLKLMMLGPKVAIFIDDPMSVTDHSKLRTEIVIPVQLMGPPPEELPEGASIRNFEGMKTASVRLSGEYGTVEQTAFPPLVKWLMEKGHGFAGPPRFIYFHDPKGIVPADQTSEAQIPIKESQGK